MEATGRDVKQTMVLGVGNPSRGDDGLGLAGRLAAAPPAGVVVRVEGGDFGFRHGLSPPVEAALDKAEERVRNECT